MSLQCSFLSSAREVTASACFWMILFILKMRFNSWKQPSMVSYQQFIACRINLPLFKMVKVRLDSVVKVHKIHLWRHSIVLALHYFQGMACYRRATLLEVMDTRSFWNMFVFSRVIYRRSCISVVHSSNSYSSRNKKSRWWQLVSNPRRPGFGLSFESSAHPTELSQRWKKRLISDLWNI